MRGALHTSTTVEETGAELVLHRCRLGTHITNKITGVTYSHTFGGEIEIFVKRLDELVRKKIDPFRLHEPFYCLLGMCA